jgi:hypothetical protein
MFSSTPFADQLRSLVLYAARRMLLARFVQRVAHVTVDYSTVVLPLVYTYNIYSLALLVNSTIL